MIPPTEPEEGISSPSQPTAASPGRVYIREAPGVPPSSSPISQAVVVQNMCWVSGQLSTEEGRFVPGTAREEAARSFANVEAILAAAGFGLAEIVYVDVAFTNLARDLPDLNDLFAEIFPPPDRPARTIYEASALPFGGLIKVQAVAVRA